MDVLHLPPSRWVAPVGMVVTMMCLSGCLGDPQLKDCSHFPGHPACGPEQADANGVDASADAEIQMPGDAEPPLVDATVAECTPGMAESCTLELDACDGAQRICEENGRWSRCQPIMQPVPESCNQIDDDCDGNVDELLTQPCGSDVGLCAPGVETCSDGQWVGCDADWLPGEALETCNEVDDDCDGNLDENIPFLKRDVIQVTGGQFDHSPSIAAVGDTFGIVYAQQVVRDVQGVFMERRDLNGDLLGEAMRLDSNDGGLITVEVTATTIAPWAGQGEGGFLVAWGERRQAEMGARLQIAYIGPDGQRIGRALSIVRPGGSINVSRITRISSAGTGGDGVGLTFDTGHSARLYYIYLPGIGTNQVLTEEVSTDAWGGSITSLGAQRFLVAYGTYRSRVCRPSPCNADTSPAGLYFVEYDGTQPLRTQRVYYGDPDDMPHVQVTPTGLITLWEAFLLGDYLIEFGHFDPVSWAETHNAPTRLDRGHGTARNPTSALAVDANGLPTRLAVFWTDERTGDERVYYRPLHFAAGSWRTTALDRSFFPNRMNVVSPQAAAIGGTFAVVATDNAEGDSDPPSDTGIIFAIGELDCPKLEEGGRPN